MIKPTESNYKCLQKSNRNTKEYSMTKTVSYNIKKVLAGTMLVALPFAFGGCEKDPAKPDNKKHNVELVYGKLPSTQWQNISLDTLYKYNFDPTVDSIFMIPETHNQYGTFPTNQLKTLVTKLRERHNVNPNKVFGKGELQLKNESIINNPEIVRFFADTLRYNVTSR